MKHPDHYRRRAEELRTIADDMQADEPRAMMQRMAEGYDALADGGLRRCTRCARPFAPGEYPLAMWTSDGAAVQLCEDCADRDAGDGESDP